MQIKSLLVLLMWSVFTSAFCQIQYDENFIDKIALSEQQHRKLNTDGIVLANSGNYDLKYAKITIFPLAVFTGGNLSGNVLYVLHRISGSQLEFDLRNGMNIDAVVINGVPTTVTQSGDIVTVDMPNGSSSFYDTIVMENKECGLDLAEARMYENRHGRFTAVDPLLASGKSANPQTFNRFVYCGNTPLACTDPTGLIGDWYQSTETTTTRTKTGETHTHSLTTYTEFNEDPGGTWTRVDFGASAYLVLGTDLGTEYIYRSGGNDFGERARDIASGMLACVPAYQCAGLGDPSTRAAQQQAMSEFGTGFVMGVRNELRASVDIPNRNFGPALLPIVGSRALTLDLRPIHFGVSPWFDYETPEGPNQIVGEFTGRFATSTAITGGVGGASNAAVRGISALRAFQSGGSTFAERLFNSKVFGKDSYLFGNKHFSATRTPGLLNAPKSRFKVGWNNTSTEIGFIWPKNIRLFGDGGHQFRFGFGASGNQAFKHLYVPRTYVPNSFANPLMFP